MLFLAFLVWNWLFGLFAASWVILALSHSKQRFCCFVANFLFSAVFALKKKVLTLLQLITLFSLILHRIMYMKHFEWIEIWFTLVHLIQKIPTEVFPNCCIDIMNRTMFLFFFFLEGTVTNPAICNWFFTRPVFSYLCPRATVRLSWVAEYISTFVAFFHKYISRFAGRVVFLSKHIGHYLKPTYESSLFSLSNHFGWQKNIGFRMNLYKQ